MGQASVRRMIGMLSLAAILALSFCLYSQSLQDGDFFWHLSTGKWIFDNQSLPDRDPFSYMVDGDNPYRPESGRVAFLLKQYWLGQLALFGVWQLGGAAGVVLLRTLVYAGILALLFTWMRRQRGGAGPWLLLLPVAFLLAEYPNERPQLFSFLFMPLTLLLLEQLRTRSRPSVTGPALLGVMLIWANTHGAFLVGLVLIAIYCGVHLLTTLRNPGVRREPLLAYGLPAVLITLVNPTGWQGFVEIFNVLPLYARGIQENITPYRAALAMGEYFPAYWLFLVVAIGTLLWKRKAVEPVHLAVLAALTLLSLSGLRHMIYLPLAAPLVCSCWPEIRWRKWGGVSLALLTLVLLTATRLPAAWQFRPARGFPTEAVAFVERVKPNGRLFNFYDWGGYLTWYLRDYPVFIDGRALVEEVDAQYKEVLWGDAWSDILARHQVEIVMLPGVSAQTGKIYPVVLKLAASPGWQLVHGDDVALVFLRRSPANAKVLGQYAGTVADVHRHIVARAGWLLAESHPARPADFYLSQANSQYFLGDRDAARQSYAEVLKFRPDDAIARRMLP